MTLKIFRTAAHSITSFYHERVTQPNKNCSCIVFTWKLFSFLLKINQTVLLDLTTFECHEAISKSKI